MKHYLTIDKAVTVNATGHYVGREPNSERIKIDIRDEDGDVFTAYLTIEQSSNLSTQMIGCQYMFQQDRKGEPR